MMIKYLNKKQYWKATLHWSAPHKWHSGEGVELEERLKGESGLYRFEMRHGGQKESRKNAYIGMTHSQTFNGRLHNSADRIKKIDNWFPKSQLWVAVAEIDLNGSYHRRVRYEDLEGILIYFTHPEKNERKKKWEPNGYFKIENRGHRGPLPRLIEYPVANIVK
ncbi:MAG: hypothetical protein O8C64_00405 [Candidatus Methanoperedens sp.]|nr:hypothetical protein [Candidatus Methanoperedens sp.]